MPVNNGKIRGLSPWLSDDLSGRERRLAGRFLEKLIDDGPNGACDSKAFRGAMEATARQPRTIFRDDGDFGARSRTRSSERDEKVEAEVSVPRLARAAMEPPSATAPSSMARRRFAQASRAARRARSAREISWPCARIAQTRPGLSLWGRGRSKLSFLAPEIDSLRLGRRGRESC